MAGGIVQRLIEFYEMVSLNEGALRGKEKLAILKARLALRVFERAMQSLKAECSEVQSPTESLVGPGHGPVDAWAVAAEVRGCHQCERREENVPANPF